MSPTILPRRRRLSSDSGAGKPGAARATAPAAARALALGLAFALVAACAHRPPPPAEHPGAADLERRQAEFFDALAARDADRVAGLFHETGVVHIANRPAIEGREAIRDLYRGMFRFLAASAAVPHRLEVAAAGDMAFGTGAASNRFETPQGAVEYAGKYVLVWRQQDDAWWIVLYAVSSDEPASHGNAPR